MRMLRNIWGSMLVDFKVLKGEIVLNDIISTFNDLYYKIQISHNICLADVRNICLKSYNNSVVCDVDGGARKFITKY